MKKALSLLLALVMAVGLVVPVLAAPGDNEGDGEEQPYTLNTLLQLVDGVDGVTDEAKTAAKAYLETNFMVSDDGRFLMLKNVSFWNDRFYERTSMQKAAEGALNAYNDQIKGVLDTLSVPYGNKQDLTFGSLIQMYRDGQKYPAIKINDIWGEDGPDTGDVVGVENLKVTEANKDYVNENAVTAAKEYFNKYFQYKAIDNDDYTVAFKDEYCGENGPTEQTMRAAIQAYDALDTNVGAMLLLNELHFRIYDGNTYVCCRFWRLIDTFNRQLNGGQGGDDGPGGEDRRTGTVTDPDTLENATTKKYLADYINYEGTGGQFTIKDAEIDAKTGLYKDEAARQAAIAAYNAFCSLGPNADGLYSLYVKNSSGQECWFYERMEELRQLADNGSGGYTDTNALNKRLRDAGYAVPVLGRDLKISFPAELQRGVEYDYTYDQTSGHLTVTVKKGNSDRWLNAAQSSFSNDSVMFNMTLLNTNNKSCWQFWNGNNDDGTWEQFVNGAMVLEKEKMSQFDNGDILAVVNRENDTLSMNPSADDRNYRVLMIWADENEPFPQMTKFMFTYEVKVEESFHYERAGVPTTGKVDMSRVEVGGLPENWTCDKNEAGVLKIWCGNEGDGKLTGKVTITAPSGYKLVKDESYVANGGDNQMKDIQDDATSCTIPLSDSRNTFIFTWKNDKGEKKQESLDVFAMQNSMDDLGKYEVGADGKVTQRQEELSVTKPTGVTNPTNAQTKVTYNAKDGFFYTTFTNGALPTYEQLQEGVLLTPDKFEGATHFRKVDQSTGDTPKQEETTAQSLVLGFAAMGEDKTYAITDSNNNSLRTLAYVSTDYQEIGGIKVSYAATQGYRCKIVQWLKQETDGKYTVLGYSYVWGRNDAFISKVRTPSIAEDKIGTRDTPFVIGQGMELCCDRYPQIGGSGEIQYFQFRATGEHSGSYTVYIPYSYFGLTWEQAKTRTQKPVIKHYYEDHTWREDIQGEYTEYGVKFTTTSFSPFVVDTEVKSSPSHYYYYTPATTAKNSPKTFDPGVALYVGLTLTSATGLAWLGRKKH